MRCLACGTRHNTAADFEHFVKIDPSGCHLWLGGKAGGSSHLGRYGYRTIDGKNIYAHRLQWARVHGPIPSGMEIDHVCRVRNCVNVEHLRMVTRRENLMADGSMAQCAINSAKKRAGIPMRLGRYLYKE